MISIVLMTPVVAGLSWWCLPETFSQGAMSFLFAECIYVAGYIVFLSVSRAFFAGVLTTIGFVVGAVASIMFGWFNVRIAVHANARPRHQC